MPTVTPITPNVGAEISDVDLTDVNDAQADALRAALIDRKALVFRDQDISTVQFAAFMQIFGETLKEYLVVEDCNPPEVGSIHIRPDAT
ncbi:MAG: TauD/TfdA family dioxygenase, partial [Rhodospirillaceae bacterium]|nr:TauD/TfdA family dioxygenase [Rhodospirillaceae bacterium]